MLMQAREVKLKLLEAALQRQEDPEAPSKLAMLIDEIYEATYQATAEPAIKLNDNEKIQYKNEWFTQSERVARLKKLRGQALSMVRGKFTQILMENMKYDPNWDTVSASYDPLKFMALIEKTILTQTEDQYSFATMYKQKLAFYSFCQHNLTKDQWYERFNTKVDIGSAIGKFLLKYVAQESNIKYDEMSTEEQEDFKKNSEEIYLSYVFLRQSGKQHNKLNNDLKNNFKTSDERMPKKRQMTRHLLDNFTKNPVVSQPTSGGVAFSQKGDMNKKNTSTKIRSSWKTISDTVVERQGTQHPIAKTIPGKLLIRIRMTKSREPAGQATPSGRTSDV